MHDRSLRPARDPRSRRSASWRHVRPAARSRSRTRMANAPGWAEHLAGVDPQPSPRARRSPSCRCCASPTLGPADRKPAVRRLQRHRRPARRAAVHVARARSSSPRATAPTGGSTARALFAAGFRAGDIVHNTFTYHLTPGGWIMEAGAHALGCAVIPAGTGKTEQQLEAIAHLKPTAILGTPDFLKILLDKAEKAGKDVSSLKAALVPARRCRRSLRAELAARGVAVLQCYATADLGMIAYESPALEGMIVDEGVIVEIVRPGTGDPGRRRARSARWSSPRSTATIR